jgi:5'-3' exoribonuclease 1
MFVHDQTQQENYPSSQPGFFPDIIKCQCRSEPFNLPTLGNGVDLILGLLDGVHLGASALAGFPTLKTLPHQGTLGYHGVSVFQADSRNQSMVITLTPKHEKVKNTAEVAKSTINQRTFHSWPYLHEGMVVAVSDEMFRYEMQRMGNVEKVVSTPHNPYQAIAWKKQADHLESWHSKRYGVIIANVDVVLHIRPLKGQHCTLKGVVVANLEEQVYEDSILEHWSRIMTVRRRRLLRLSSLLFRRSHLKMRGIL